MAQIQQELKPLFKKFGLNKSKKPHAVPSTTQNIKNLRIEINQWTKTPCIYIKSETNPFEIINFMNEVWNKNKPKLILSITGGARNFNLGPEIKKSFKEGLIKAAKSTGAWIITGGTNYGVMRLVGDAVSEAIDTRSLVVLGISTGPLITSTNINDTQNIDILKNDQECKLNPYHSHFILVSDAKKTDFGQEIQLRSKLERQLIENPDKTEEDGNMVLIVIGGGKGTLQTVFETLEKEIPVLLLENSGGCADVVIKVCDKMNTSEHEFEKLINEIRFDGLKDREDALKYLKSIKQQWRKRPHLINIFGFDCNNRDFEQTVIAALIHKNNVTDCSLAAFHKYMKLALQWNATLIAKNELFLESLPKIRKCRSANEDSITKTLNELLFQAICDDRPDFVEMLLDNGANVNSFLDDKNLEDLYRNITSQHKKLPFVFILGNYDLPNRSITTSIKTRVNKKLQNLVWCDLDIKENLLNSKKYPEQNLFLLALLFNRFDIAFIFWRKGYNQIINALFAAHFLEKLSTNYRSDKEELMKQSKRFENAAIGTIKKIDENTHYFINFCTLFRHIDFFETNVLEMAVACRRRDFLTQSALLIDTVFDDIWYGLIDDYGFLFYKIILSLLSLGLLAPVFYSTNTVNRVDGEMSNEEKDLVKKDYHSYNKYSQQIMEKLEYYYGIDVTTSGEKRCVNRVFKNNYCRNYKAFMTTPMVHFTYALIFFISFLLVLSYFLIIEFPICPKFSRSALIVYIVLNVMFLSLLTDELYQILNPVYKVKGSNNILSNIKYYLRDRWNITDFLGIIVFIPADIFLLVYLFQKDETLSAKYRHLSKFLFCVDLIIWCIRSLHFCTMSRYLGPKLKMLPKVIKDDLRFFLAVIVIISLAFGIVSNIALSQHDRVDITPGIASNNISIVNNKTIISSPPTDEPELKLSVILRNIIHNAYWPIFGELKVYDQIKCKEEKCANNNWQRFVFVLLMIYALTILVLVNLLIAMINSTFQKVHEKTDFIWKYQRFFLIFNDFNYSSVPPPFNIFYRIFCITQCFACMRKQNRNSAVAHEENEYLLFERQCANEYWRESEEKS